MAVCSTAVAVVAVVQLRQDGADQARLVDGSAQIAASALLARAEPQHRPVEAVFGQVVLARPLVLEILLGLAALDLIERRLGDIDVAALNQFAHLPEEEREQQRADVRAVDVGVRHDDDLVVAQLVRVEVVPPDAGAERRDQRADLLAGQHLVEARPLDVQDLAAQRQHGLIFAVAALLGRAAGRIALDQEQFGERGVALLAIGELAGQVGDIERALAAGEFARLAGRFARRGGFRHLGGDDLAVGRMLLEPLAERLVDDAFDHRPHLGGDQLVLGLRREFRVRHLHREHAGQALAAIVAGDVDLLALADARALGIAGHLPGQRRPGSRPDACRRRAAGCCW